MSPHIVDMGLHGRAGRFAIAGRQRLDDRQVLVADLIDALGQAAQPEHGRALPEIADRGRQHRIARGRRDGDMEVAIILACGVAQTFVAQACDARPRFGDDRRLH